MSFPTTTQDLANSLPIMVAAARSVREYAGVMPQTAEVHTLDANSGQDWKEVTLAQLTAQAVQETTDLQNPQAYSDTNQTIEPTLIGLPTLVSLRATRKISQKTVAEMGVLAQNGMTRKNDQDGIAVMDGFTGSAPGEGSALTTSILRHMVAKIRGNTTEPSPDGAPVYIVLHTFQIADIEDELVKSAGDNYELTSGLSAQVFQNNVIGKIANATVLRDDNISIDSAVDAKGGVFSRAAMLLIRGTSPYVLTEERPGLGGGSIAIFHYDEYAWGERTSQGTSVWGHEVYSDATAPA